jgi:enterochelin esterase-like enzyme
MKNILPAFRLALAIFAVSFFAVSADASIKFKIKIDPAMTADGPVSGRLLIFMTRQEKPLEMIEPDFTNPDAVWISGMEVTNFTADKPVLLDADDLSFPQAFSTAPKGEYQIQALLDVDHSYTYNGTGDGDIYSAVRKAKMPDDETELTLSNRLTPQQTAIPEKTYMINFESPALTKFWGRPVKMQASVVLPPSYDKDDGTQKFPVVYDVHGYSGTNLSSMRGVLKMRQEMKDGKRPEMIYVYLNAQCPMGHHVFADSANNGPWGTALVNDLIPFLEKEFHMDARPSGRFLTGHSSGGWTTLWVMVTHPDFFGGTWSTSPDPVDFHNFTGPDLTRYPPQNFYRGDNGKPYNLVRMDGKELMSLEQYARQERVLGLYGGQMASFEAVFSPKGADGRPMPLFDRDTGKIDPDVQRAWEKYDISRCLDLNWRTLGPKLKGKVHITVGTADTFHLDEAVRLLDAKLRSLGSDAKITYLAGKTHFDLYQDGLELQMAREMYAVARPKGAAKVIKAKAAGSQAKH